MAQRVSVQGLASRHKNSLIRRKPKSQSSISWQDLLLNNNDLRLEWAYSGCDIAYGLLEEIRRRYFRAFMISGW